MIGTVLAHQLRWLAASRTVLATALLTGFTVALAGLIALHDATQRALAASAILWLVTTVAGLVASARVIAHEEGTGGVRALLLAPIDRRDLFLARAMTTAILVLTLSTTAWLLLALVFPDLAHLRSPTPVPAVLVGSLGLGVLGTLAGWAALSTRAGELVGPVLAIPLAAPLVIACLHATETTLQTGAAWGPSLTFATGYALAVTALSYLVADHVVEVP